MTKREILHNNQIRFNLLLPGTLPSKVQSYPEYLYNSFSNFNALLNKSRTYLFRTDSMYFVIKKKHGRNCRFLIKGWKNCVLNCKKHHLQILKISWSLFSSFILHLDEILYKTDIHDFFILWFDTKWQSHKLGTHLKEGIYSINVL